MMSVTLWTVREPEPPYDQSEVSDYAICKWVLEAWSRNESDIVSLRLTFFRRKLLRHVYASRPADIKDVRARIIANNVTVIRGAIDAHMLQYYIASDESFENISDALRAYCKGLVSESGYAEYDTIDFIRTDSTTIISTDFDWIIVQRCPAADIL